MNPTPDQNTLVLNNRVPTFATGVPEITSPGFCTVWVPTLPSGSCFTFKSLTPTEAEPLGVVTFAGVTAGAVTGAVVGILTVIVGVGLIGVDIDDWEIVRATTGLART